MKANMRSKFRWNFPVKILTLLWLFVSILPIQRIYAQTTFSNTNAITINDATSASPYPSSIAVSGLSGTILNVSVTINGFSHQSPSDVDMLLAGPGGQAFVFWSDAGGFTAVSGLNVTLSDAASSSLPPSLSGGTYKPTDYIGSHSFPSPAPTVYSDAAPIGSATFNSVFGGTSPNGTWSLYIVDASGGGGIGSISGGWSITITTPSLLPTTTVINSGLNPSFTNQAVIFTSTTTSSSPVNTGTVTFKDGATVLASNVPVNGSGAATCNVPANTFSAGNHIITAQYNGSATYNLSSGNITQTVFSGVCPPANIVYVNTNATGANNGTSWTDAFTKLQDALSLTNHCSGITQIWVAKGTYYPDEGVSFTDNDITAAFTMKNNLGIYGGFSGTENLLSDRDWTANPTILSGDINKNNTPDNAIDSRHVIFNNFTSGAPLTSSAILDGFTISGGYASGYTGGGMYNKNASPTISHCTFSGNTSVGANGAGMYNEASSPNVSYCTFSNNFSNIGAGGGMCNLNSSPAVSHCMFSNNISSGSGTSGGGMANFSSSPTISYCTFSNNSLQGSGRGGGMTNENSSPGIINCIFTGNQASQGGGMYNRGVCTASIINCTFSGNTAATGNGGGISNELSTCQPTIKNCIFWADGTDEIVNFSSANPGVTYSDVQGSYPGAGNLNADPLFVSTSNLHLQTGSPAINAGTNTGAPTIDIEGNPRPLTVANPADMGAYEFQSVCPPSNIVYVNANATGANNGTSWADAFTSLQDALNITNSCSAITQIWVAAGTYNPTTGTDRTVSFVMKNGLAIYGGFAGGETQLSQRNWSTNVTILSGDLSGDDVVSGSGATLSIANNGENSLHVIFNYNNGLDGTAVLDGFTITGGNADDISLFPNYLGGGMINRNSSPTVTNCIFSGNSGRSAGGMYNLISSSPTVTNCSFLRNSSLFDGGGMFNATSSPILANCSFSGNSANRDGGSIYNVSNSFPTLTNCIVWGNSSDMYNDGSGLTTITYSIVEGGYSGTGNLNVDPLFVSTSDLHLQPCSPAIDNGNDAANATTTDLDGNNRKVDAIAGGSLIDMGAYEYQSTVTLTTWYTDADGDTYGTGSGQAFCSNPGSGWASRAGDCDDNDATINPDTKWYKDADNDNYSDGTIQTQCDRPTGYKLPSELTALNGDCDDADASINPATVWYKDADNDNYSDGTTQTQCERPTGYKLASELAATNGDCDDSNPLLKPTTVWYKDADNDGYSDGITQMQCIRPANYKLQSELTATTGDCDDANATINPATVWYKDADNDGYSDGTTQTQCTRPSGYKLASELTSTSGDCDDTKASVHPGAVEICGNGIDDNCNGQVDEGCSTCGVTATVSTGTISCYGGLTTITVKASGGKTPYQYKLSGGLNFQLYNTFIVGAGTYSVTVKDKTGCTKTISNIVITQPPLLTLTLVQKVDVSCRNGSNGLISVSAGGGTSPYSYKLNSGSYKSSGLFQNLKAGTYTVTVKDAKGCIKYISVTIKNGTGSCSSLAATSEKLTGWFLEAQVMPNPTVHEFTLNLKGNSSEPVTIRVMDMYGRTIYQVKGSANQSYKFGQRFAAGAYIVEIMQGEHIKTLKVIKN